MRRSLTKFGWIFECWAVQKRVNLVDLVKSLSLFLNLLFETDPYSNEYLLLKIYSLTVTTWEYYHGIKIVFFRSTNQVRTAITNSMKWSEPHCFTPLSDFGSANLVRTTKIHILRFGSANQVRQKFGSGVIVLSRGHSQRVLHIRWRISRFPRLRPWKRKM